MWQDRSGQFALQRPENERWMFRAGVRGPDGEPVPLLALSQETGAQLVVQSADGIHDLRLLARMLMENLANEAQVHVEDVERLLARGGEAYGFSFTVADETRGRVAMRMHVRPPVGGRARTRRGTAGKARGQDPPAAALEPEHEDAAVGERAASAAA